jgi:hypothetical protein
MAPPSRSVRRNHRLEAVIAETGWTQDQAASHVRRVAAESGTDDLARVSRSHVAQWLRGVQPSGRAPHVLAEALSRRLGRVVTPAKIGLHTAPGAEGHGSGGDTLPAAALADLGGIDLDITRRRVLVDSAYSVAGLAVPSDTWWQERRERAGARYSRRGLPVTAADVAGVREMTGFFSRRDQQRGGRSGRTALVAYLRYEVADFLQGAYASQDIRAQMTSAVSELTYLAGWTAFNAGEHPLAQRYFRHAMELAAEADDAPLAGHILRAMAHQALDLGHPRHALALADASVQGARYAHASPREQALLGVVHARTLAAMGQRKDEAAALTRAEDDLRAADDGQPEPDRVFFFTQASLAHETARTLADLGDLAGAEREFDRSVRTRPTQPFARTHAVTLGYLGAVQIGRGHLDTAIATWNQALDAMGGVQSGRTREAVVRMRRALSAFRGRGGALATRLDDRARTALPAVS